jgi:hypothetical protein
MEQGQTDLRFLNRREAAAYLTDKHGIKTSPATLATQASRGGGPPFRKYGRVPVYRPDDLDAHVAAKLSAPRRSTSEADTEQRAA